jgi:HK97 family phage major capsid protein
MPEITNEEVMTAITELRSDFETKGNTPQFDKDKEKRITAVCDEYEKKSAEFTALEQASANLEQDLKDIKTLRVEEKEADEKRAKEVKTQIDDLETEIARGHERLTQVDPDAFKETEEYKAINTFCKTPDNELTVETKALLRSDSAVDGGILVPTELDNIIVKKITEIDAIRGVARVRSIGGKSMEMAIRNTIPIATFEGEAEEGGDSTSSYESITVTPFRQTFTTPITKDQLMDSQFDMESEITSDAGEAFAFGEGNGFVAGTGHKQPAGFTVDAILQAAALDSAGSSIIDEDDPIEIQGELKVGYNPVFVMTRKTLAQIRLKKSTTGSYLWLPGLNGPKANTLAGSRYILAPSMPEEGTDAFALAYGDFRRGYTIVDRVGLSVIRDEFTLKKKAIIEFTMNRWVTGLVNLPEAIKLLKLTA